MGVEIDALPERLDDRDNAGLECFPRRSLKIEEKCRLGTALKIAQELALELKEEAQHLGKDEDHLTMRDI